MHMVEAWGIESAEWCCPSKRYVDTFKQKRYKTAALSHTHPACRRLGMWRFGFGREKQARFIEHREQNLSMTRLNHPNPAPTPTIADLLPIISEETAS